MDNGKLSKPRLILTQKHVSHSQMKFTINAAKAKERGIPEDTSLSSSLELSSLINSSRFGCWS